MFILNEEIREQERQAIRELYPKFPDTQVIVTKVPLKPFYKAHRTHCKIYTFYKENFWKLYPSRLWIIK